MAEYKRPTNEQEYRQNFAQKKPLMNQTEASYESARCLFCYDAPCMIACPTHIDIPLFIKQISTGNTKGAAQAIYEANWLGNVCGKVCPTSELCEGSCVYDNQNVPVIQIGRLQNFATNQMIEDDVSLFEVGEENGRKVAVIGAGPAGIACACELRKMGYKVNVFEAKEKPSGLVVHGIAPYKITNKEVLDEIDFLQQQLDFSIYYSTPIISKQQLDELELNYDAIFLGVGVGGTARLGLPGEELENVVGAVEFIEDLRMEQYKMKIPNQVVVIGGGNTAVDAASESARMGASNITLAYRRSKEVMGAYKFEYVLAKSSGVKGLFNASPKEIVGKDKVEGVRFVRTETIDGALTDIQGSDFVVACELVIKATGQAKQADFLNQIDGLELDKRKRIIVNKETFQTANPKYFAGGDGLNGGAEVVNAVYDGKMAAKGINNWMNEKS